MNWGRVLPGVLVGALIVVAARALADPPEQDWYQLSPHPDWRSFVVEGASPVRMTGVGLAEVSEGRPDPEHVVVLRKRGATEWWRSLRSWSRVRKPPRFGAFRLRFPEGSLAQEHRAPPESRYRRRSAGRIASACVHAEALAGPGEVCLFPRFCCDPARPLRFGEGDTAVVIREPIAPTPGHLEVLRPAAPDPPVYRAEGSGRYEVFQNAALAAAQRALFDLSGRGVSWTTFGQYQESRDAVAVYSTPLAREDSSVRSVAIADARVDPSGETLILMTVQDSALAHRAQVWRLGEELDLVLSVDAPVVSRLDWLGSRAAVCFLGEDVLLAQSLARGGDVPQLELQLKRAEASGPAQTLQLPVPQMLHGSSLADLGLWQELQAIPDLDGDGVDDLRVFVCVRHDDAWAVVSIDLSGADLEPLRRGPDA